MADPTRRYLFRAGVSLVVLGVVAGTVAGSTASNPTTVGSTTYPDSRTIERRLAVDDEQLVQANREPGDNFSVPAPDHGLEASTFARLWSGDIDETDTDAEGTVEDVLLSRSDYAFDRPPEAVESWNVGDHRDFPSTDVDASVYPTHADRIDELWIRDAYIEVFAIQPSTVAHFSPNDTPHYIRRSGEVLGTTDYRIGLPPDERHDYDPPAPDSGETVLLEKTVSWELLGHEMSDITLEADGEPVDSTGATHTPRLEFSSLPSSTDRLSLVVTISASFERTTRRKYRSAYEDCDTRTIEEGNETRTVTECDVEYDTYWSTDVDRPSRHVTVRDSVDVDVYELAPTASRTAFADGRSALAVNQSNGDPWASYRFPDSGSVHNIWHFYSARDHQWDTLVEASESGTNHRPSDAIPLQVHAFPSGGGAYARSKFGELEVTQVWGAERPAPNLPEAITLPVVDEPYSTGSVVIAKSGSPADWEGEVTVEGLVRGTEAKTPIRTTRRQEATTLDIELLDVNRSAETVTVRISLRESASDRPIDLRPRPGVVEVHGVEAEPNASGTAVVTAPLVGSFVTAEYRPGPWWATHPAYESTRASVDLPADWPNPRRLVVAGVSLMIWLVPLLLVVYFIDRLLGRGQLWPPWRGLE